MAETTSLGAAMAAAISMKLWSPKLNETEQLENSEDVVTFKPQMKSQIRDEKFQKRTQAIQRSLGWEN